MRICPDVPKQQVILQAVMRIVNIPDSVYWDKRAPIGTFRLKVCMQLCNAPLSLPIYRAEPC